MPPEKRRLLLRERLGKGLAEEIPLLKWWEVSRPLCKGPCIHHSAARVSILCASPPSRVREPEEHRGTSLEVQCWLQPGATRVSRDIRSVGGGRCCLPKHGGALPVNCAWTGAGSDGERLNPTGEELPGGSTSPTAAKSILPVCACGRVASAIIHRIHRLQQMSEVGTSDPSSRLQSDRRSTSGGFLPLLFYND